MHSIIETGFTEYLTLYQELFQVLGIEQGTNL